jgi:Cu(I)-responsive transcriptional regulator
MTLMGIGAIARQAGVGIDTVRYYERAGLLDPKQRLASGYRRYSATELARLRFIRRAQALGFSLEEIRELLALSSRRDVARVKRTAADKVQQIEARIAELQRIRDGLASLVEACPGHGRAAQCPILRALAGEQA